MKKISMNPIVSLKVFHVGGDWVEVKMRGIYNNVNNKKREKQGNINKMSIKTRKNPSLL